MIDSAVWFGAGAACGVVVGWLWLAFGRGGWWRTNHRLILGSVRGEGPSVAAVIPARDEGAVLPETLPSVLGQRYRGLRRVVVVTEEGGGETARVAREAAAAASGRGEIVEVMARALLAEGWAGKVHALQQGIERAGDAEYLWLSDADIAYEPDVLESLVAKAEGDDLDVVSVMAELRNDGWWERLLIPAFVYFFGMLYPFGWTNGDRRRTSGAAGGCMLVRRSALAAAGGYESIRDAVIDDCAMAARIREHGRTGGRGRLWIGLSHRVRSVRDYGGLDGIRTMVERTAFDQLGYSWLKVAGTAAGLALLFWGPVAATVVGAFAGGTAGLVLLDAGVVAWGLMAALYLPMLRFYGQSAAWALAMPATAGVYAAMTLGSGVRGRRV